MGVVSAYALACGACDDSVGGWEAVWGSLVEGLCTSVSVWAYMMAWVDRSGTARPSGRGVMHQCVWAYVTMA